MLNHFNNALYLKPSSLFITNSLLIPKSGVLFIKKLDLIMFWDPMNHVLLLSNNDILFCSEDKMNSKVCNKIDKHNKLQFFTFPRALFFY